jgi:hypothetical protein
MEELDDMDIWVGVAVLAVFGLLKVSSYFT